MPSRDRRAVGLGALDDEQDRGGVGAADAWRLGGCGGRPAMFVLDGSSTSSAPPKATLCACGATSTTPARMSDVQRF